MEKEKQLRSEERKDICSLDIPWWVGAPSGRERRKTRAAKTGPAVQAAVSSK